MEPNPDSRAQAVSRPDTDDEIAQVRAARHRISERAGHDPRRLVAHYIESQKNHQAHAGRPDGEPAEDPT
jgi:hypothetical protein